MQAAAEDPAADCTAAARAAEQAHGLPPGLLLAIGRVESGRMLPGEMRPVPWPWAINAEGRGAMLDTPAQAIAEVEALQARGVRSVDVGCFQVNLLHHPAAFANLDQAFTPAANADYAATFLTELRERAGDWPTAVGWYHSTTPELAEPYRQMVWATWQGVSAPPAPMFASLRVSAGPAYVQAGGWAVSGMRIFTPATAALPLGSRMPVVFRPSGRG